MTTPHQIRAARALLNWSQNDLAKQSGLALPSIANIELGKQHPTLKTIELINRTFNESGIEFLPHDGVQRKTGSVRSFIGKSGFQEFLREVDYVATRHPDSTFKVCNVNEMLFVRWLDTEDIAKHTEVMLEQRIQYRIIVAEGDDFMPASHYGAYRWASKESFYSVPLYIYADNVAFIGFEENSVSVFVITHPIISGLCALQFDEMWSRSKPVKKAKAAPAAGKR